MNPFWTVSLFWGTAVVCVLIALAFILPALLRARSGTSQAARRARTVVFPEPGPATTHKGPTP